MKGRDVVELDDIEDLVGEAWLLCDRCGVIAGDGDPKPSFIRTFRRQNRDDEGHATIGVPYP